MPTAAIAHADTGPSYAALRLHLSETTGELEDLRAALDTKLATLEAALANPDECDSLETLVIELARVATTEAEAAAARTCLAAQLAASEQVTTVHADAQRLVQAEREAAHAIRAQLEDAQATLQIERMAGAKLRRDLEELRSAVEGERTAARALRQTLEEAEQRVFVVENTKELEVSGVREELGIELAAQRAAAAQLERALEELRHELVAARDAADKGLADFEAGQLRIEAAERQTAEIERACRDADARAEAAVQEGAGLAAELQAAHEAADRTLADVEAAHEAAQQRLADADAAREAAEQRFADAEAARDATEQKLADAEVARDATERKLADAEVAREAGEQRLADAEATGEAAQQRLADAARDAAHKGRADFEAAKLRIVAVELQAAEIDRARRDAEARAKAALQERATLAAELQAARETTEQRLAQAEAAREVAEKRLADVAAARQAAEQRLGDAEAAREAAEQRLPDAEAARLRLEAAERQTGDIERERQDADARAEAALAERAALAGELQTALELAAKRLADVEAAELLLDTAEDQRRHTEQERLEADARAEAALSDRAALTAELQAAREAAGAGSAMLARLEAADAERAEMGRALKETERSLESAAHDRDSGRAALDAALQSAHAEAAEAEARYDELRDATALRIRELELDLLEAASINPSGASATLDVDVEDYEPFGDEADSAKAAAPSAADTSYVDRPTRRASRTVLHDEWEVQVDDMPAVLVDISVNGAQILSPTALKPNRSVTLLLPLGDSAIQCIGKVVWARFEASSDAIRYRGGIYFTSVDSAAIEAFVARIAPSAL